MKNKWVIKQTLAADQDPVSVRELLQKQWLLPKKFVHYLRIRQNVSFNGRYRNMNEPVKPGDQVQLLFEGDEFRTIQDYRPDPAAKLDVIYEDDNFLVINKPAGQKSHPNEAGESGTAMNAAAAYLGGQAFMVHRLDQQTSGAMMIAKNPVVVPIMDRLISQGQIHRSYLALVQGSLQPQQGTWSWPIGFDPYDKRKRLVNGLTSQPAVTHYQVQAESPRYSLVKLTLETGRTHQLRVHLKHDWHPIVGDPLYNPHFRPGQQMLLHGAWLNLILPFSGEKMEVKAPLPSYFRQAIEKCHLTE